MIMNSELRKEADYFTVLFWHLLGRTEEKHEESLIRIVSFS
jgi:hypothetical protein